MSHPTYTYADLKRVLDAMPADELAQTATVYVGGMDEYVPVVKIGHTDSMVDVLDEGHLVLGV